MKMKPLKGLSDLHWTEVEEIASWYDRKSYREIAEAIAKPRAEGGYGVRVSEKTLRNHFQRVCALHDLGQREESASQAAEFLKVSAGGEVDFKAATVAVLEQRAFELAVGESPLKEVDWCLRMVDRQRRTGLREREVIVKERLATTRERMATVREVLAHGHVGEEGLTQRAPRSQSSQRCLRTATIVEEGTQGTQGVLADGCLHTATVEEGCSETEGEGAAVLGFEVSEELRPYVTADGEVDLGAMNRDGLEVHDLARMFCPKEDLARSSRRTRRGEEEERERGLTQSSLRAQSAQSGEGQDMDGMDAMDEMDGNEPVLLGPVWQANWPYPYPADWPPYPLVPVEAPPYRWDDHFKQWYQFPVLRFNERPYRWDIEQQNWTTRPAPRVGAEIRGGPNVPHPYPADWPPYPDLPPEAPPWRWDAPIHKWYGYPELPAGSPPYRWDAVNRCWEAPAAAA